MARRAGANIFTMAATSGPSSSSQDNHSSATTATGALAHSPGGIRSSARSPVGLGGSPGGESPPIFPGLAGSREIGRRDDRSLRRRSEAGRARGMTVLPGVAELEGGVGPYNDDDDDDDDEEEEEKDEEEEEEAEIKKEEEDWKMRSRRA